VNVDLRTTLGQVPWARDVVRVSGDDAASFLQGQLSQDIDRLEPGSASWSWLLQPQGKVDALVRVTRDDDGFRIDTDEGWGDAVVTRLRRFVLRVKVAVDAVSSSCIAVRGPSATAIPGVAAGWPGVEGVDVFDSALLDGPPAAERGDLEALRVECGFPLMGRELGPDTIPAEAGQWLIDRTVSFTKGCFTGQELVARIDSRGGNVPRPIRGLILDGDQVPVPDAVVMASDAAVGRITSAAHSATLGAPVALAVLARSVAAGDEVTVQADGEPPQAARVAALPLVT
jgi:tRNA-modifying protein YgfZ